MLQIYNSFTQKKAPFTPRVKGEVSLYVCGITVYDYCHIGHARVFVAFDVMVRFLKSSGWKVKYIRNITDIDDKIIKRANENNENIDALTTRFIEAMNEDMGALGVAPADSEPRATRYMDEIIKMIEVLEEKGVAYVGELGDVYYQVDRYPSYGQLSHKDLEQLQVGTRVEVVQDKRSPLDFVLWKKAKPNEPKWPSPWGEGRPGWHIECSAMSTACLGNTFDIHGGGSDLLFPHHENERAQAEGATGETFVNHWMHIGFVVVDKEKMSKSLNNFFTIREVLEKYDAETIRYFMIASHYRSPVNYSTDQLDAAKQSLERLYTALRGLKAEPYSMENATDEYTIRYKAAMNDDFNTPIALSVLFELANAVNIARENNPSIAVQLASTLKGLANTLGLLERDPETYFQGAQDDVAKIEQLIIERETARKEKNWSRSDEIRDTLKDMGVELEDTASGTQWRRA